MECIHSCHVMSCHDMSCHERLRQDLRRPGRTGSAPSSPSGGRPPKAPTLGRGVKEGRKEARRADCGPRESRVVAPLANLDPPATHKICIYIYDFRAARTARVGEFTEGAADDDDSATAAAVSARDALFPYVAHAIATFGYRRALFAGNWYVVDAPGLPRCHFSGRLSF